MTHPDRHDDNPTPGPRADRKSEGQRISVVQSDGPCDKREKPPVAEPVESADGDVVEALTAAIRESVGETNYAHWFHRRTRLEIQGDRVLLYVPNPFIVNWLLRRFRTALNRAAQLILGPSAACQLEVDSSLVTAAEVTPMETPERESSPAPEPPKSGEAGDVAEVGLPRPVTGLHRRTRKAEPARESAADLPSGLSLPMNRRKFRSFESFVAGECNNLAVLAARQISAAPGERYNPLFIHGGTGTGKTHLLEAIYTEIRRRHPSRNVMYLTSEAFTNYFTSALASRMVPGFRQRFRNVDVLLIDNIEFLDNKRATQEEFLHTIVQLIDHGGQVVVSSDRHPRMLTKHREELTTRFQSGLVCRIESPDEDTRRRLVRMFSAGMKAVFCEETLEYLVRRCRRNTRELQGALNQLESHFALHGRRITLAAAREILGGLEDECRRLVRISDVERVVCEAFGVTAADLRSTSRRKAIALPRAVAMFMSRRMTRSAYREIGLYFGGRDHSTVVAAERKVADWMTSGEAVGLPTSCPGSTVAELIDALEQRLLAMAS